MRIYITKNVIHREIILKAVEKILFIAIQLIYNVLIAAAQQSDSVTCVVACAYAGMQVCMLRHVQLFVTPWIVPTWLLCPWSSPGKNTEVSRHFLLQGILLTQGLNPCLLHLLHWQMESLPLQHLGSQYIFIQYMIIILYIYIVYISFVLFSILVYYRILSIVALDTQ